LGGVSPEVRSHLAPDQPPKHGTPLALSCVHVPGMTTPQVLATQ
jgi:hypothetical protein